MTTAAALQEAAVRQQCKMLRMPAVAAQCVRLAEEAVRAKQNHLGYLEALLAVELEQRERNTVQRRIHDVRLPRIKTLEEFDFTQSPKISRAPAGTRGGGYIERAEPIIFIGDCDPETFCTSSLHR
jgi:DNA replication protein DnaC